MVRSIVNGCVEIQFLSTEDTIFNNILRAQKKFGISSYNKLEMPKISGVINYIKDEIPHVTYNAADCCLSVKGPLECFISGQALYFLSEYMFECLQSP